MKISVIAAVGRRGQIARDGIIPWRCSEDMKHFRKQTSGCAMLCGATTFAEVAPLVRSSLVATRRLIVGMSTKDNVRQVLREIEFHGYNHTWIIGGAKFYDAFAPLVNGEIDINVIGYDSPPEDDHRHLFFPLERYGLSLKDLR